MAKRKTSDALDIIHRRHYAGRPKRIAELEEERQNAAIARRLYALRKKKGLTQSQLARRIGTATSVISRLEDSRYEGHTLNMIRRVAKGIGADVEVRIVDRKNK